MVIFNKRHEWAVLLKNIVKRTRKYHNHEAQSSRDIKTLRKHAYSNILKISPTKTESFQIKNSDIFHISAQNIDCVYSLEPPRRGGSNEYPQSMFWAEMWKIIITPVNLSFSIYKWCLRGKLYRYIFVMERKYQIKSEQMPDMKPLSTEKNCNKGTALEW